MIIYLIHFTRKYHHAGHYIGSTINLVRRLDQHLSERRGLFGAVNKARIPWLVARTWESPDRELEFQLKSRKDAAQLCPICRAKAGLSNEILPASQACKQSPTRGIGASPTRGIAPAEPSALS